MQKIYTLTTRLMNGTVTIQQSSSSFVTRDLAEKAKAAVDEAYKGTYKGTAPLSVWSSIEESEIYETENEVPILNWNINFKIN